MAPATRTPKWFNPDTPEKKKLFEQAKDEVRMALLCCKEGTSTHQIQGVVEEGGGSIPFRRMGFNYFEEFLFHIDDILEVRMLPYNDRKYLFIRDTAMTENDKHMRDLVKEQSSTKTKGSQVRATFRNTKLVPSDLLLQMNPHQRAYQPGSAAAARERLSGRRGRGGSSGNVRYKPPPRFGAQGGGASRSSRPSFATARSSPYMSFKPTVSSLKPTVIRTFTEDGIQIETASSLNDVKNTFRSAVPIPAVSTSTNSRPVQIRIGNEVIYPGGMPGNANAGTTPAPVPIPKPAPRDSHVEDVGWDEVDTTQIQEPRGNYRPATDRDPIRAAMARRYIPIDEIESSEDDGDFEMFSPSTGAKDKKSEPVFVKAAVAVNKVEVVSPLVETKPTELAIKPQQPMSPEVVKAERMSPVPVAQPIQKVVSIESNTLETNNRYSGARAVNSVPTMGGGDGGGNKVEKSVDKVYQNGVRSDVDKNLKSSTPTLKFKTQVENYINQCEFQANNPKIITDALKPIYDNASFDENKKYPLGLGVKLDWEKLMVHNPGMPIPYVRVPLWNIVEFKLAQYEDPENFMISRMFSPAPGLMHMNFWYQISSARLPEIGLDDLLQNGLYAGYCRETRKWMRIQVDLRQGVLDDKIDVIDIDEGRKMQIHRCDIKFLKPKFSEFPRTAFLADVFVAEGEPKENEAIKQQFSRHMASRVGKNLKTLVAAQIEDSFTGIPFLRTRFFVFGDVEVSVNYVKNQK